MLKAVVFDLDHTLFDRYATFKCILSKEEAYTVFNRDLGEEKLLSLWCKLDKRFIHFEKPWDLIYDAFVMEDAILHGIKKKSFFNEQIAKLYRLGAVLYGDTIDTLVKLKQAGFKLGIITNGSPDIQRNKLSLLDISEHFDEIIVSGEYNTNKPDEKLFDMMAERLSLKTEEILFVGDHPKNDIWGARNAGMSTAWINATGHWELPELPRADYEINTLSELCDLLIK